MKVTRINNPFIVPIKDYYKIKFENSGRRVVISYYDNIKSQVDEGNSVLINEIEYFHKYTQAYDLDQLSLLRGFTDAQVWQFADIGASLVRPVALFELTVSRRSQPETMPAINGVLTGTSLIVPFAASPVADLTLVINCTNETLIEVINGTEPTLSEFTKAYDLWFSLLPTISLSIDSIVNDVHIIDIQTNAPINTSLAISEVYLDLIGGILLTPRVKTNAEGSAKAYIKLDGLPTGYECYLKAGFKFTTNMGDLTLIKE